MTQPRLKILAEPCAGCPFKGRFDLRPGRLLDIVETCERDEAYFACHQTVYGADGERGSSDAVFGSGWVCRGWLDAAEARRRVPAVVQIAGRLGLVHTGSPEDPS